MRFGGPQIGVAGNPATITIVPAGGSTFTPGTIGQGLSPTAAFEAILNTIAAGAAYAASIVGTAAAANKAVAELNNPNASGKFVYVYSMDLFVPVTMAVNLFLAGTSLAPVGTGFNLSVGGAGGVAKVGGGNQLATAGNLVYTSPTLAANAQFVVNLPWIVRLPANTNIQLQGQTVNQAFTCNVRWFEAGA